MFKFEGTQTLDDITTKVIKDQDIFDDYFSLPQDLRMDIIDHIREEVTKAMQEGQQQVHITRASIDSYRARIGK